jgi:membrane protein implicated in regulation of membrane protease activity
LYFLSWDIYSSAGIFIFILILFKFFQNTNLQIAFKEWVLLLYALNYLLAPAISLHLEQEKVAYQIKLNAEQYYTLMIPGFLCFYWGMNSIKTNVFNTDFNLIKIYSLLNEKILKQLFWLGIALKFIQSFVPGELGFFIYVLSMVRFVGAFALYAVNKRKYFHWLVFVLLLEVLQAFVVGMYHDMSMWLAFFFIFYIYIKKPSVKWKISFALISIVSILFIQSIKQFYRAATWSGDREASLSTAIDIAENNTSVESLTGETNLLSTLTRSNQAWIFASTVDHMERYKDFQGLTNVQLYTEAALLPRFLAPNKIMAGDKVIFNKFSGHTINEGTSMGLGIFADGYIAYGAWGVAIFGFALGLLFSITFKVVENWTKISPFFMLFLFPILNYAVRPDCETQTTINHLVKSMFIYWLLVIAYRRYFSQKLTLLRKQNLI